MKHFLQEKAAVVCKCFLKAKSCPAVTCCNVARPHHQGWARSFSWLPSRFAKRKARLNWNMILKRSLTVSMPWPTGTQVVASSQHQTRQGAQQLQWLCRLWPFHNFPQTLCWMLDVRMSGCGSCPGSHPHPLDVAIILDGSESGTPDDNRRSRYDGHRWDRGGHHFAEEPQLEAMYFHVQQTNALFKCLHRTCTVCKCVDEISSRRLSSQAVVDALTTASATAGAQLSLESIRIPCKSSSCPRTKSCSPVQSLTVAFIPLHHIFCQLYIYTYIIYIYYTWYTYIYVYNINIFLIIYLNNAWFMRLCSKPRPHWETRQTSHRLLSLFFRVSSDVS